MDTFPSRVFIQVFEKGRLPPDYALVVAEMKSRGVPVITKTTDEILRSPMPLTTKDLVVGNFFWTRTALKQLGIPMPTAPDYPNCLRHLLHRKVWQSSLGEVQTLLKSPKSKDLEIFIKPAIDAKAFAAIIEPQDQMLDTLIAGIPGVLEGLPKNFPVHCSERVEMLSEYRVYVVHGEIRAICQYRKQEESSAIPAAPDLDINIVENSVQMLFSNTEGQNLAGCALDFAVMKKGEDDYVTCLVEVNDGFSLRRYEGISGKDYTDLLIARWAHLVTTKK